MNVMFVLWAILVVLILLTIMVDHELTQIINLLDKLVKARIKLD